MSKFIFILLGSTNNGESVRVSPSDHIATVFVVPSPSSPPPDDPPKLSPPLIYVPPIIKSAAITP